MVLIVAASDETNFEEKQLIVQSSLRKMLTDLAATSQTNSPNEESPNPKKSYRSLPFDHHHHHPKTTQNRHRPTDQSKGQKQKNEEPHVDGVVLLPHAKESSPPPPGKDGRCKP